VSRRRDPCPVKGGFTLIELIVVIAVIATLASVVGPSVFRNAGDAKSSATRSQVEILALALNAYRLDNDVFPSSEQGLEALRVQPAIGVPAVNWRGPYLSKLVPLDPWGRPYVYLCPGTANPETFDIYSLGRDGRVGGLGEDADITSWGGPVSP
jgi:general secretion pathway protein G